MSLFTGKKLRVYDGTPVGQVVQSPINLETMTNGQWIALDGRDCSRGQYPELAPYFPAGVFTSTARTLQAAPVVANITADGSNFVSIGAAGQDPVAASADGVTWAALGTSWTAATSAASLILAGPRFVVAGSGGDLTQPYVSTANTFSAANQVTKANWTATTGGTTPTTTLMTGLAYGNGRTVLCRNGSLTVAAGLFYMNDAGTAWVACTAGTGTTVSRTGVVFDGSVFIVFTTTGIIQTSSDGITWNDYATTTSLGGAQFFATDGNGTVVAFYYSASNAMFFVSKDRGVTWRVVQPPMEAYISVTGVNRVLDSNGLSYANGKFFLFTSSSTNCLISSDGLSWFIEPINRRSANIAQMAKIAYKSGTYCAVYTATAALTTIEDMSKFRLSRTALHATGSDANMPSNGDSFAFYMKARSN